MVFKSKATGEVEVMNKRKISENAQREKIVLFERHCCFDSVCYRLKAIARSWGDGGAVVLTDYELLESSTTPK